MCGILPISGRASGGHGRMQACVMSGSGLPSFLLIVEKEAAAALTRAGSACTWPRDGGDRGVSKKVPVPSRLQGAWRPTSQLCTLRNRWRRLANQIAKACRGAYRMHFDGPTSPGG
eukprot:scaffold37403_cov33-Tisochrysis_lutea.AAC.1